MSPPGVHLCRCLESRCFCSADHMSSIFQRMVHLAVLRDTDGYGGPADPSDPEMELRGGLGVVDASLETSGFYGTDLEDRDKGDEGLEDQGRRDGEEEWEREDRDRREGYEGGHTVFSSSEVNHTSPDLDTLIG